MKFCQKCGKEIMDEAVICPGCGCAISNATSAKKEVSYDDAVSKAAIPPFYTRLSSDQSELFHAAYMDSKTQLSITKHQNGK